MLLLLVLVSSMFHKYLFLSTGTRSIVGRVYVLVDMYLDYKVLVISILVAMNVMLPPTSVVFSIHSQGEDCCWLLRSHHYHYHSIGGVLLLFWIPLSL